MAYKIADYIQSNGTYFRTGIIHGTNPKVKMDFTVVSNYTSSNNYVFGVFSPSFYNSGSIALNAYGSSLKFMYYIGGVYNDNNDNAANFTIGDRYECTLDKTALLINNKTTSSSTTVTITGSVPSATTQDYAIGALNRILDNRGILYQSNIYIYEVTIYEDDVIVAHYLPYGDTATGYGLLYDTVSGNYLTANEPSKTTAFFKRFSIDPENIEFSYSGGTSALTISCDGDWSASTNSEWITLSSESGSGDSTINITASANTGLQRTGTVSITDGNDTLTCTISQDKYPVLVKSDNIYFEDTRVNKMYLNGALIYQNMFALVFDIDTTEVEMEYTGGTFSAAITTNRPWSLTTPEWISASTVSGIKSSTVTFTVGENTGSTAIVGNISVTCNNVTKQINVTQKTNVQYVSAVYKQDGTASYLMTIDTGFKATLDTVMRINYIGRGIQNGDTLMGYSPNMPNCSGDSRDYRYFSVSNCVYRDFNTTRNYIISGYYQDGVEYDISFYNNYLYDNINSTIFDSGDTQNYIGSPNATIHVDIGSVKLKEFKITQGGVLVFDGKAAVLDGVVGLYDSVSEQIFTCPNTTMIYDE